MENNPENTLSHDEIRGSGSMEKPSGGGTYRMLARYCWLSIPIAMLFNFFFQVGRTQTPTRADLVAGAILAAIVPVSGVLAGLISFFGIPRHGRRGILWPALIGLFLWGGMTAMAIPTFHRIQKRAMELQARATAQTPAVLTPGAIRLEDKELNFSFDIPEGYEPFLESKKPASCKHAYGQENEYEPLRILMVMDLGKGLPRRRIQSRDLPPSTPEKSLSVAAPFSWRGIEVDAVRVLETQGPLKYVTFQIQIPLRGRAIQIGVGGQGHAENAIRRLADQVLASLEGTPGW
jgi:hypothetical protein